MTLGIFAALLASSAGAEIEPGQARYFKNWAAGCDNGLTCEAVALMPQEKGKERNLTFVVTRDIRADDGLIIRVQDIDSSSDRYRMFVDRRVVDTGPIDVKERSITLLGQDALKVARALAKGRNAQLVDGMGKNLGDISLAGSAAALRYLDSRQGYAGASDAIAERGKSETLLKPPALPEILAKRIKSKGVIPEAADLVALAEGSQCARARYDVTIDTVHSLGNGSGKPAALALINCGGGAFNQTSAAYLGVQAADGKWRFEPAQLDFNNQAAKKERGLILLQNAAWDAATQRLSTVTKGRGIGDCGYSAEYVWDGRSFRLTNAREMKICKGARYWITTWQAKVQFEP